MRKTIIYLIRFIFLGLIFFEGANHFGFLKFNLDYSWLGLILTAAVVWFVLEFLNYFSRKKYQFNFPVLIFIIPTLDILLDAFGDIFHWYSRIDGYDKALHFLGGVSITLLFYFILRGVFKKRETIFSDRFLVIVAFLISNFLGILYELEEYAESLFLHNNRLGDRFDTPGDLFFNMMGAGLGVIIVILVMKIKNKESL